MGNALFGRHRFEREMQEEFTFHVEQQTQLLMKSGLDAREARRRALLSFGAMEGIAEEARETRALVWLANLWRDVRIALRGLRKNPGFTSIAVLILALAIGANTAIFSIIDATILKRLPYAEPERIVGVWETKGDWNRMSISYPNFKDCLVRQTAFDALAICAPRSQIMQRDKHSARVDVNYVTGQFFDVLRVEPQAGRPMTEADDAPGADPVAWVTEGFCHEFLGGSAAAVGQSFQLGDRVYEVAGVLPADFRYPRPASIYLTLAPSPEAVFMQDRNNHNNNSGIARLKDGVTLESALEQMQGIAAALGEIHPQSKGISVNLIPLRESLTQSVRERVFLLNGAVGLLLLIACVNIANMLLARGFSRGREIAIRVAVGATRMQVLRQLLVESLVLAGLGGIAGVWLGYHASVFATRLIPWGMRNVLGGGPAFDLRICAFAIAVTLVTGLLFGFAPAWRLSHTRPSAVLKDVPGGSGGHGRRIGGTDVLVVVQVALVIVLLVSTGLLLRSLQRVMDVPIGIEPAHLISFQIAPPSVDVFRSDPEAFVRFHQEALARLQALAEVESAAIASAIPFSNESSHPMFYRADKPVPPESEMPAASVHYVSHDYFRTLGIPTLAGRTFDTSDARTRYPEGVELSLANASRLFGGTTFSAVISQRMAEQFWPGEDALGKVFHIGTPAWGMPPAIVVGIVGNTTQGGMESGDTAEFYLSVDQILLSAEPHFVVRTRTDPRDASAALRKAAETAGHPVHNLRPMQERVDSFVADRRFNAQLFLFFAGAALLLAAAGIYGVLSFVTARRTRDLGVRLALGAPRSRLLLEVLLRGMRLVGIGLAVGLPGAFVAQRFLQGQLFGIQGVDPLAYVTGCILLLLVSGLACFLPAWRAARLDPMTALRAE